MRSLTEVEVVEQLQFERERAETAETALAIVWQERDSFRDQARINAETVAEQQRVIADLQAQLAGAASRVTALSAQCDSLLAIDAEELGIGQSSVPSVSLLLFGNDVHTAAKRLGLMPSYFMRTQSEGVLRGSMRIQLQGAPYHLTVRAIEAQKGEPAEQRVTRLPAPPWPPHPHSPNPTRAA